MFDIVHDTELHSYLFLIVLRVKVSGAASNVWMWIVTLSLSAFSNCILERLVSDGFIATAFGLFMLLFDPSRICSVGFKRRISCHCYSGSINQ